LQYLLEIGEDAIKMDRNLLIGKIARHPRLKHL